MKDAGFIASTKIILKKPLPTPGEGGSLSRSGLSSPPLSAVCHAGLRVPAPPILELPSLFFSPYSSNRPLLLDFLSTRWSAFYTHTHKHTSTCPSPLLLALPITELQPRNLEAGFNMMPHACFCSPFPFPGCHASQRGPPPSLNLWDSG